jgi:hypothetical protein
LYDQTVELFIRVENEHLSEEEQWLDELRPKLSVQQIIDLEDTIINAKENAPLHPHPMAPSKPSTGANILH